MPAATTAFWMAAAVVIYVYVAYPALLALWSRLAPRPIEARPITPPVSIVIAARNESEQLAARLDNLFALDYPSTLIEIIVVSDGSTDSTADVLGRFGTAIRAVFLPPGGKAHALNVGVALASHPILVFTDARQLFAADALRRLVGPFADPQVGGVSGELVLDAEAGAAAGSGITDGVGGYWRYEKWLRRQESLIGSTLGATGAIYALRRELWKPLPSQTILDDVLAPMRAVLASHRVVFEGSALAFDRTVSAPAELRRKIRTLAGNVQLLWLEPRLLDPFTNPVWIQFLSHKLGRLLVPYALLALLVASAVLTPRSTVYAAALAAQIGFYTLAAYGAYLDYRDRALADGEPSAMAALARYVKGSR